MIIIIIGIIGKMFKNSQKSNQKRPHQPNSKLDPMHPNHFDVKSLRTQMEEMCSQVKAEEVKKKNQSNYQYQPEIIEITGRGNEVVEEQYVEAETSSSKRPTTTDTKPKTTRRHAHLKKSTIVEGIIWSEILGPPRGYKKWSSK